MENIALQNQSNCKAFFIYTSYVYLNRADGEIKKKIISNQRGQGDFKVSEGPFPLAIRVL